MSRAQLTSPSGEPTGAIYGFLNVLFKVLSEDQYDYVCVAWDSKEKTFRHEMYPDYKSHRKVPPPDIIPQIFKIQELLTLAQIPQEKVPGFEADDIIGTLCHLYSQKSIDSVILSSDKDFMQLVDSSVSILSLKVKDNYVLIKEPEVEEYFGVPPHQVIDILALQGDASDGVPGVPGIGPKAAQKLIKEYGSLDNIYHQIESIEPIRVRKLLEENRDKAFISLKLVLIHKEISTFQNHTHEYLGNPLLKFEFAEALKALGMQSFLGKVSNTPPSASWGKRDYKLIETKEDLKALLDKLTDSNLEAFSFDTETTGLDIISDKPIAVTFSLGEGEAYFISLDPLTEELKVFLESVFSQRKAIAVAHNLKFDIQMLLNLGIDIGKSKFACSMVAAWIIDPDKLSYSLDKLCLQEFRLEKIPFESLFEGKDRTIAHVPMETLKEYACEDADATLRLWNRYKDKMNSLFWDLEMPFLKVLVDMERTGTYIDSDYLKDLSKDLKIKLQKVEEEIIEMVGEPFNIGSPAQLGKMLFEKMKIQDLTTPSIKVPKTSLGFKTSASVLQQFDTHPCVKKVLEFREISKILNTYTLKLPQMINPQTGRVHARFHQTGTGTGRLSSSDPNLQNIPTRTSLGKEIRKAFCASSPDILICSADYSQIELRILAHVTQDLSMKDAFNHNRDIHQETAAKIFHKPLEDVTPGERNQAKAINFGIVYGMGPYRLSKVLEISYGEAKSFIDKYFLNFPKIKEFIEDQRAIEDKIVTTLLGRHRQLKDGDENAAINSPIQGSAADIMKLGMLRLFDALEKLPIRVKMVIQVHDELLIEVPKDHQKEVEALIYEALENAFSLDVPLKINVGWGNNWMETK